MERMGYVSFAMVATASSAQVEPSTSAKRKIHPSPSRRRPSSLAMLVLPILRCPVNSRWLRSRTWDSQNPEFALPVEEVVAAYPGGPAVGLMAFPGLGGTWCRKKIHNDLVVNNIVVYWSARRLAARPSPDSDNG